MLDVTSTVRTSELCVHSQEPLGRRLGMVVKATDGHTVELIEKLGDGEDEAAQRRLESSRPRVFEKIRLQSEHAERDHQ